MERILITEHEFFDEKEFKALLGYFATKNDKLLKDNLNDEFLSQFIFAVGEDENGDLWITTNEEFEGWIKLVDFDKKEEEN